MQTSDQLIRTKLRLPFTRPELVFRLRLHEQIARGLLGPLTLITAPAGFGKTTLVASCVASCGLPAAWLSLDKDDSQTERFLSYLIASMQEVDLTIGREAAQLLSASQQAPSETVLTSLINDLNTTSGEIALVLDDYHFISNQTIHSLMSFLLEHCPKSFHLVIVTRSDPPLPLARLRARGQMVELRTEDLRFTETEAVQFLNDIMRLHLDRESAAQLEERTEGWIAGLQMAALSMRNREDVPGFIEGFSGTNRYIMDYLMEEVLANQPPEIQKFLLFTSILERLTAPLCDAVLANDVASETEDDYGSSNSKSQPLRESFPILKYLEGANLFLVALDDQGVWYRYHHLFAGLLRARLSHSPHQQSKKVLHARAAVWYEINGFPEEAIHHALAAEDYTSAARLVEAIAENAWLNGRYTSILAWTEALPMELVHSRPWLCIWKAWAYTQIGDYQVIAQWIEAAELSAGNETQDTQALLNAIAALKVFAVSFMKDYERAIELAEDVIKGPLLKHKNAPQLIRCNILHVLSSMYFATGQLHKAEQTCQETIELANRIGFTLRYLHAVNKLILIYQVNGQLICANRRIEEAQAVLQRQGYSNYFAAFQLHFRRIEILYQWNRLDEAQPITDFLNKQQSAIKMPYLLVGFYNVRAYSLLIRQDFVGSQNALDSATFHAQKSYIWEGLTWQTEALQVKLWLRKGDAALAAAWTAEQVFDHKGAISYANETRALSQARVLLAQDKPQEAIAILDLMAESAKVDGRKGSLIETCILKGIALQQGGGLTQAAREVENALALAEPEGYVRIFLDEGRPMQMLLTRWVAHAGAGPLRDYAIRLLFQFDAEPLVVTAAQKKASPVVDMVEPLSKRELEVLKLIALGKTNQEIARQIIVSKGTVKAHTASIYRKLDVANRTEAVARARQLGILL